MPNPANRLALVSVPDWPSEALRAGVDLVSPKGSREDRVDTNQLEHGCRMIHAGLPSFFGRGGRSCSNFLGSAVLLGGAQGASIMVPYSI